MAACIYVYVYMCVYMCMYTVYIYIHIDIYVYKYVLYKYIYMYIVTLYKVLDRVKSSGPGHEYKYSEGGWGHRFFYDDKWRHNHRE